MQPEIRYTVTEDGQDIAFWAIGSGPTLIQCPLIPYSHIELEWHNPHIRQWYESLSEVFRVVRYDGRGSGHSTRRTEATDLEAHYRDLQAVIRELGPDPVAVMGVFHSGPAAILYASRHPEIISHLVLWCTYAAGQEYWRAVTAEGLRALRQTDYELFLRTAAHQLLGWDAGEDSDSFAGLMSAAVSPEMADRLIDSTHDFDVGAVLEDVVCPTLVVHRSDLRWLDAELSRSLTARLADGRLAVVPGESPYPAAGDIEPALAAIRSFLDVSEPAVRSSAGDFRAVLFTDLVDHTRLVAGLGDELGREMLRWHELLTREVLKQHRGTEVKTLGDGFMASFSTVTDAVRCAVALQTRFAVWNQEPEAGLPEMSVRIGINAGEPVEEDGDLFGSSVILAARVAATANAGEILVSNAVRELAAGKGFGFAHPREIEAKGFDEPIRVWSVDWRPPPSGPSEN